MCLCPIPPVTWACLLGQPSSLFVGIEPFPPSKSCLKGRDRNGSFAGSVQAGFPPGKCVVNVLGQVTKQGCFFFGGERGLHTPHSQLLGPENSGFLGLT